jgi:hypothetical protein
VEAEPGLEEARAVAGGAMGEEAGAGRRLLAGREAGRVAAGLQQFVRGFMVKV